MSKKLGITFIIIGFALIFAPWLAPFIERLPEYIDVVFNILLTIFTLIHRYKPILERLFPASLILLGFTILSRGYLRRVLILFTLLVALISLSAMILPGYESGKEGKIEFFTGKTVVVWEGEEMADGFRVVKVRGNSLDVKFFAGSLEIFLPTDRDVSVNIKGGVGEIKIFAPKNVRVRVEGDLGIGNFESDHSPTNPDHLAKIEYELGIGEMRIEELR
jgi:hypothetical protein